MAAARKSRSLGPVTPLDLPPDVRHLMVFGGTFDPPHFYHTIGPWVALQRVLPERSWLLYVPAARNPLKPGSPVASDEHRLAMLKLALDVPVRRSIWTDEIDRARRLKRGGASFTIDTLKRLRRELDRRGREHVRLYLLIGADQAVRFHRWKDPRGILRLATPVIMPRIASWQSGNGMRRGPSTMSALIERPRDLYAALEDAEFWTRSELAEWSSRLAPMFPMDPASTDIRSRIPGAPADAARWRNRHLGSVPGEVAEFVIGHNLYGFRRGPVKPVTPEEARMGLAGDRPGRMQRLIRSAEAAFDRVLAADPIGAAHMKRRRRGARRSRRPTRSPS